MTLLKTNWFQLRFCRLMAFFLTSFLISALCTENFATTYVFQDASQVQNGPTRATRTYRVKPGDTKFSLSRAFDVSIDQLENENPQIKRQLLAGQIITVSNAKDPATMYIVVAGDTKFSLAKNNGLTVEQLEASNPHIKSMLISGQVLHIPNTNQGNYLSTTVSNATPAVEEPKTAANGKPSITENYEFYTVQPDDTLWGLSQRAGMSVSEFSKLNPNISEDLKAGTTVKMPLNSIKIKATSNTSSGYANLLSKANSSKKVDLVLLMEKDSKSHEDFIKGANMAIDSLKKIGLNINLKNHSPDELTTNTGNFSGIILPKKPSNNVISAINKIDNTPIFSVSPLKKEGKNIITVNPADQNPKTGLLTYIKEKNFNVVVVSDPKQADDIQVIESIISKPNYVQTDDKGIFNKDQLLGVLKKGQPNAVIIDSSDPNVYLGVTNLLLTKLNDYQMQLAVLDGAYIPDETLVSTKRYRILKMLYPAKTPLIVSNSEAKFLRSYSKRYGAQANEEAINGFDVIFDSALRLAQNEELTNTFDNSITKQFNLKFQYKPGSNGYENHGVYLYQYDPQVGIKEIK